MPVYNIAMRNINKLADIAGGDVDGNGRVNAADINSIMRNLNKRNISVSYSI